MKLQELSRPTLIQVTAPWCTHCRSLTQHTTELNEAFSGRVDLVTVDVSSSPETAGALGVKGTPTIIGVRHGEEIFRESGRRSRDQLATMFHSVADGVDTGDRRGSDTWLAVTAGSILTAIGAISGPAWGLVIVGACVLGFGSIKILRARDH